MGRILGIIKKFSGILTGHQKLRIIELSILMLIGGILETLSVSLVLPFVNGIMNPDDFLNNQYIKLVCDMIGISSGRGAIVILAFILAAVYILKNIYLILEYNIQYRFVYGNMFEMQKRMLDSIIHRPYSYFLKINSGEVIRLVNSDVSSAFQLFSIILQIFTELVVSGMLVITIFILAPVATILIAAVLLLMLFVIDQILHPILHKAGNENSSAQSGMNKWLIQSIQGIKELKVMQKESFFQKNYSNFGNSYIKTMRKANILSILPRFIIEALSMCSFFIIVAFMILSGSALDTIIPIISAIAMAALRLLPSVNRISGALTNVSFYENKLDNMLSNIYELNEEKILHNSEKISMKENRVRNLGRMKKEISVRKITFHYPDTESYVLQKADMVIYHGESVGIIGESGAGKTTTVDIILGLLKPEGGKVLVDGNDISNSLSDWLDQVGYIPQMIFMLDDTIRNNIAFGEAEDKISEDAVWTALEEAALADFVRSLPNGLETQIGERGVRLSGGQRQRIGIARALYHDPAVLIFDEATSALDNDTEASIMESINTMQGKKTMIIIAHRLTTIENCDHIYRIENGKAVRVR